MVTRRRFLSSLAAAGASLPFRAARRAASFVRPLPRGCAARRVPVPAPWRGESAAVDGPGTGHDRHARSGACTREPCRPTRSRCRAWICRRSGLTCERKYTDLRRHFLFEYYPWYATNPWRHWNHPEPAASRGHRRDVDAELGPYDSRDLGGARAARAVDRGIRRGRHQYQLVGPRQLRRSRRAPHHGRDARSRPARHLSPRAVPRRIGPSPTSTTSCTCCASTARSGGGTRSCS